MDLTFLDQLQALIEKVITMIQEIIAKVQG